MADDRVRLEPTWKAALQDEFEKPYMTALRDFLVHEKTARKVIYPPGKQIFRALDLTPLPAVKVVIIGQDPYHGPGQAHGLCFSVVPGIPTFGPTSLHLRELTFRVYLPGATPLSSKTPSSFVVVKGPLRRVYTSGEP